YKFNIQSQDWKFNVSFKEEFTIIVNTDGGGTATGGGKYADGESCTVVATANSGKTFEGWYEGSTKVSSDASYIFTVSSNRTLTAK
ncbi:InlB B-repeat-containing protein, partial [Bacteroides sp. 51]|uniref:InlB B-repeat-containing protein n=1 Tax=Bacteroides sp. 51 TaxID=2302938 RepID=UPI0019402D93